MLGCAVAESLNQVFQLARMIWGTMTGGFSGRGSLRAKDSSPNPYNPRSQCPAEPVFPTLAELSFVADRLCRSFCFLTLSRRLLQDQAIWADPRNTGAAVETQMRALQDQVCPCFREWRALRLRRLRAGKGRASFCLILEFCFSPNAVGHDRHAGFARQSHRTGPGLRSKTSCS